MKKRVWGKAMNFITLFNQYYEKLGCTNIELSKLTNISPKDISRIKSGVCILSSSSETLKALCKAFVKIGENKNIKIEFPVIYKDFYNSLAYNEFLEIIKNEQFSNRLNMLLEETSIPNIKLAQILNIDPSYISRIRQGKRRATNKEEIISSLANYLLNYYFTNGYKEIYSKLFKVAIEDITKRILKVYSKIIFF